MTGYNSRAWHRYFDGVIKAQGGVPCSRCRGVIRPGDTYHVDHLVEQARGGGSTHDNLWPCHPRCNTRAGQALGQERRRIRKNYEQGIRKW